MPAKRTIRELDLVEFSRCLMRQPDVVEYFLPLEMMASKELLRQVLLMAFAERRIPTAIEAREMLEASWRELSKSLTAARQRVGIRAAATITRRVLDLVCEFEVVQPVTAYTLNFSKAAISGEYAVLKRRARKAGDDLIILRLREKDDRGSKEYLRMPDATDYARWLHLRMFEPSVNTIRILNWCVESEQSWFTDLVDQVRTKSALANFLEYTVSGNGVPSPGSHCNSCLTQACSPIREVA